MPCRQVAFYFQTVNYALVALNRPFFLIPERRLTFVSLSAQQSFQNSNDDSGILQNLQLAMVSNLQLGLSI